jgi:hypothetical protein
MAVSRKDGLGRVVHFHSLRKTLQTLGVQNNMNQRAAQEIFGHSDANLTAEVYTDVAALQMRGEIAKIPWISGETQKAQHSAQNSGVSRPAVSLADICTQLIEAMKVTGANEVGHALASAVTFLHSDEMAARAGIEPASAFLEVAAALISCEIGRKAEAQHGAQIFLSLAEVASKWAQLPTEIRFAVLALVRTSQGGAA